MCGGSGRRSTVSGQARVLLWPRWMTVSRVGLSAGTRWLLVAAPVVFFGCSDALTRNDGGTTGGVSGTGGTTGGVSGTGGTTGGVSGTGGSGGAGGVGPASNCQPGGAGGTSSRRYCVTQNASSCNVNVGIFSPPQGACDVENAACRGHVCANDGKIDEFEGDWASLCCGGQWLAIPPDALKSVSSPPACPTPIRPGDSFPCGDAGLSCVAGETYCARLVDQTTSSSQYSCEPLCSAGDCSCLCQPVAGVEGCYVPSQTCPGDSDCSCGPGVDALGVRQPGAVLLTCRPPHSPQIGCTRGDDCFCNGSGSHRFAYFREGAGPPRTDCVTPSSTVGSACGVETRDYCCTN